jgi:phospholipase/carboxylesterase
MTSRISSDLLRLATQPSAGTAPTRFTPDEPSSETVETPTKCQPAIETDRTTEAAPDTADEVYIPDHYEPNYPYPLMVWIVPESAPRGLLKPLMRRISERNTCGVVIRAAGPGLLEDRLMATVARTRRRYHIHSERVYLAGFGELATRALALGLSRPEWFGGIIALSPQLPLGLRPLSQFDALRGKRVFLAAFDDDRQQVDEIEALQKLLWSAGLSVRACACESPEPDDCGLLREIDRWMIQAIEEAASVA